MILFSALKFKLLCKSWKCPSFFQLSSLLSVADIIICSTDYIARVLVFILDHGVIWRRESMDTDDTT